jgi:glycosyltransferase involved in cell wall biosynthesis
MDKKKINNDITVIIPVFNVNLTLFNNAITSLKQQFEVPQEVLVVVGDETEDYKIVKDVDYGGLNVTILNHKESTSFATQMNLGVDACKTKWISFLEQDDEMSSLWFKNVVRYRDVYKDVHIFLPLILDVSPEGLFLGMANDAVWASEFSDEIGYLDNAALLRYQNFNFDGMVMLKEVYQEFGGIKDSVKLTFMYEFLLRLTYHSSKVMVIPKLGYKHMNLRVGGLFDKYKNELTYDESRWWLALAKKEYFHINDRKIQYEKTD